METSQIATDRSFDLAQIGPFTESETSAMLNALFQKIDIPFRSSDPAPKRPFIDFFGTQKSMKTTTTGKVEQVFRRHGFKTYCPPESAEHEDIRADVADDLIVFQAKHLNVVADQNLNLPKSRDYHLAIISRGLLDMLYWYEKGLRKSKYSSTHVQSAKNYIYELLKQNLVDVFLFFTCSVETAMKREYEFALTQKRGSKMNEKDIDEGLNIYKTILQELEVNVPSLPIFHIDTSEMDVRQAAEESLRFILPTLCARFNVPDYSFMPYTLSLVQRKAEHSERFEEQLKLRGITTKKLLGEEGWNFIRESEQEDVYLNPNPDTDKIDPLGEVMRLRYDGDEIKFMYKGPNRDRILSHRRPLTLKIDLSEAEKLKTTYKPISVLSKHRHHFQKNGSTGDGHFFSLHMDAVRGLGNFTEIRAKGSADTTHTAEMLKLAEELGFRTSDIVEGNYLSLALKKNL